MSSSKSSKKTDDKALKTTSSSDDKKSSSTSKSSGSKSPRPTDGAVSASTSSGSSGKKPATTTTTSATTSPRGRRDDDSGSSARSGSGGDTGDDTNSDYSGSSGDDSNSGDGGGGGAASSSTAPVTASTSSGKKGRVPKTPKRAKPDVAPQAGKLFYRVCEASGLGVGEIEVSKKKKGAAAAGGDDEAAAAAANKSHVDPFVEVRFHAKRHHKTDVVKKNNNPNWDEKKVKLTPTKPKNNNEFINEELVFVVKDHNTLIPDRFLGQVSFYLSDLYDGIPRDEWFPLQGRPGKRDKVHGQLRLQLYFVDVKEQDKSITQDDFAFPLHSLLLKGKIDVFKRALEKKAVKLDIEDKLDANGRTGKNSALHIAARCNLPACVGLLLKAGARVGALNAERQSALHVAAASSSSESVDLLLKAGASASDVLEGADASVEEAGQRPLHWAALKNQPKNAALLLAAGAKVNAITDKGNTPLHVAISAKAHEVFRVLIDAGADLYQENGAKVSAAKLAVTTGGITKGHFKEAAGAEDDREFDILGGGKLKQRHRVEGALIDYDWTKSSQVGIKVDEPTEVAILVHYIGIRLPGVSTLEDDIAIKEGFSKAAFILIASPEGIHQEQTFDSNNKLGDGGVAAWKGTISNTHTTVVVPYSQETSAKGVFSVLVFTEPGKKVTFTEMKPWQYCEVKESQWKGKKAGGAQPNPTWEHNPEFIVTLPKEPVQVPVAIMISQKAAALNAVFRMQVNPMPIFIGFYVYDEDRQAKLYQVDKFLNAKDVFKTFVLNSKEDGHVLRIIPCTYQPGEETQFVLRLYSDVKLSLRSPKDGQASDSDSDDDSPRGEKSAKKDKSGKSEKKKSSKGKPKKE